MNTKRVHAETRFKARKEREGQPRALVPTAVRDALGALAGGALVFELGCSTACDRAALSGRPYFIVTLKAAPAEGRDAHESDAAAHAHAQPLPGLAEEVNRKMGARDAARRN